jgi:hypothetical protein
MYTLLILISVFAMRVCHNHAQTARNLRRSFRSAAADARLIQADGLDRESPPDLATSQPMHWKSCVGFSAALIDVSDGVKDEGM